MSDEQKAYRRTASYLRAVVKLFHEVNAERKPADRVLRSYFAQNRQCGSKDRRFISNSLYSLFRWYGWIREFLPGEILASAGY